MRRPKRGASSSHGGGGDVADALLVLRSSTAFQQLSAPDRRFLVRHCTEATRQAGETVVAAGAPADTVAIVVQGKLRVRGGGGAVERAISPRRVAPAKPWAQPVASPRRALSDSAASAAAAAAAAATTAAAEVAAAAARGAAGLGAVVEVGLGEYVSCLTLRAADICPFDVIVANILARPLCDMAPALARHLALAGVAVLAGLLSRQEAEIRAAYRAQGLYVMGRFESAGWPVLVVAGPARARWRGLDYSA